LLHSHRALSEDDDGGSEPPGAQSEGAAVGGSANASRRRSLSETSASTVSPDGKSRTVMMANADGLQLGTSGNIVLEAYGGEMALVWEQSRPDNGIEHPTHARDVNGSAKLGASATDVVQIPGMVQGHNAEFVGTMNLSESTVHLRTVKFAKGLEIAGEDES